MNNEKVNILNLTQEELTEFLVSLGLKKFYGKEVFIWLHKKIIRNFDDMTNLSLKDREILKENAYIPFFNLLKHQVSKLDKTEKFLFELEDKGTIETVLLRHRDSKNKEIRVDLINYIDKSCDFFHIIYKFIREKAMVKYVTELISEKLSSIDMDNNLSLEKARKIIRAGQKKAQKMDIAAVFAVVNPEGNLIIEERMDNAILVSVEVAYKKAYTAAALKLNTQDLTALVQPGAMFYGLQSDPKYIVFGGGMLLKVDGKIVGAVGVSGGSAQEDMEIAKACVKAFETI